MKAILPFGALVAALVLPAATAAAAPPRATIRVVGDGACPTAVALASRLVAVLSDHNIVVGGSEQAALTVEVFSDKARYGVVVNGRRRTLLDEAGDCDARARAVAVVAALELYPPTVVDTGPDEAPAAKVHKSATPAASGPRVAVDLAPLFETASGSFAGGFAARVFLGNERFGVAVGAGGLSPAVSELENAVRVKTWRVPFDVSFRAQHVFGRFELAGDVGLAATVTGMSGEGLPVAAGATRLELGARVAAVLRYRVRPRVAPFLSLQAVLVPAPFELGRDDGRVLGALSHLRFGVLLGLSLALR